jgi:WD40 repeat protein
MSIELEHAIGCNVGFKNICHLHPGGKDYVKAVGGVVLVGDINNPHEQAFLQGHDDFITCVAVSHNGRYCASGSQGANSDVILWDLDSKTEVYKWEEQDHGIDCVAFSHDDRFVFACGDAVDGRLFVYDTSTGYIIAWAQLNPKPTIALLAGGMVKDIKRRDTHEYCLAACGGRNQLTFWHLDDQTGDITAHPVGQSGKQQREFSCLAFTNDYEYLLVGTTTGDLAVVLMKNRVVQTFHHVCGGGVTTMVCIPEAGRCRVVTGGGDGTATVLCGSSALDLIEERQIRLDGPVASLSLSGDCAEVMAVSNVGSSFQIRTKDLSVKLHNQVATGALYDVAYPSNNSELFLTCCGDGLVTMWDANDYSARLRCPVRTRAHPISVAASEDFIVAGCSDGRLMSWDAQEGQNLWHIDNAHKGGVTTVKISHNVRFVMSGGAEGEIRVWELKTKDMVSHLKEHGARVNEVQMFPNDQYAISCSRDRCLLTWDLRQEKRLTAHREKHGGINCMAVATNQTTVVTAGQEKTLTYWDLRMADPVRSIDLDEEVLSITMSPDDRFVATCGTGLVVKVWDVAMGAEMSRGAGHSRPAQKISFSPDGKQH